MWTHLSGTRRKSKMQNKAKTQFIKRSHLLLHTDRAHFFRRHLLKGSVEGLLLVMEFVLIRSVPFASLRVNPRPPPVSSSPESPPPISSSPGGPPPVFYSRGGPTPISSSPGGPPTVSSSPGGPSPVSSPGRHFGRPCV